MLPTVQSVALNVTLLYHIITNVKPGNYGLQRYNLIQRRKRAAVSAAFEDN